jgi:biopolymer transport protein ExbD
MLVLLIIFMVTARIALAPPKGVPLTLPKSATGESVELVFALALYTDGSATVNGQRLASDDDILTQGKAEHDAHPEVRAVIQADGKVLHERVVHAVDLLSQAGISQIAFGVTLSQPAPLPTAIAQ